ncbi:hypothetical protein JW948_14205 [bacterium]|nr:hypothetical protein [bacterium]
MKNCRMNPVRFLIFLPLIFGCTSTRTIGPDQDLQVNRPAVLVTCDGTEMDIDRAWTEEDSVLAVDRYDKTQLKFPRTGVQRICVTDRGKGAAKGLLFGGGAGLLYGIGAGLAVESDDALAQPVAAGFVGGILFGAAGAAAGYVTGENDITVLGPCEPPVRTTESGMVHASNRKRYCWYIYGESGYGPGNLSVQSGETSSGGRNGMVGSPGGAYEIGFPLNADRLIGFHAGGWGSDEDKLEGTIERGILNFSLVMTSFTGRGDMFWRAGLGYSSFEYALKENDRLLTKETRHGLNGMFGAGYTQWLGGHFNLLAGIGVSGHVFENKRSAARIEGTLGIMWY